MLRVSRITVVLFFSLVLNVCFAEDPVWRQVYTGMMEGETARLYTPINQYDLAFGDVDNDGDEDIFVGGWRYCSFFRNDGTTSKPYWTLVDENYFNLSQGNTTAYTCPTLADIDEDGDLDIFIGVWTGGIRFYRNNGTINSPQWDLETTNFAGIDVGYHANPVFADIDNDGDLDLFVGNGSPSSGQIYFYQNNQITPGNPVFNLISSNYSGIATLYASPVFEDIDLDGDLDLLQAGHIYDEIGKIWFRENIGNKNTPVWGPVDETKFSFAESVYLARYPAFFDYDGDGDNDFLNGALEYYERTESATGQIIFTPKESFFSGFCKGAFHCSYGDLDVDGDLDMIITDSYARKLYRVWNIGGPTNAHWDSPQTVADIPPSEIYIFRGSADLADLDRDGDLDIFLGYTTVYHQHGYIAYYENDGRGNFPTSDLYYMSMPDNASEIVPEFCDIDADGDLDLFVGLSLNWIASGVDLRFYRNDALTPADPPVWNLITTDYVVPSNSSQPYAELKPTFSDIDNDGDYDLFLGATSLIGNSSFSVINFFENIGTPENAVWNTRVDNYLGLDLLAYVKVETPDLDGDGDSELLIAIDEFAGQVRLFMNEATKLNITPKTSTLSNSESINMITTATPPVTWSLYSDNSGATLIPSGTACQYIAGATAGVVDVIEVRDASGAIGRAHINVISLEEIGRAGKAVIVAGWKGAGDPLWPDTARSTTNYLANFAYRTLLHRGFSKENVYYLSPDPAQDVDGDGTNNDVDAESTLLNVQYALSDWAGQAPAPAKLLVYLVDHGGEQGAGQGYLRLNPGEVLLAQTMDSWLDALQAAHPELEVTLAVDACHSGSFLDECLAPTGLDRVTLASAEAGQDAFFSAGGAISFSEAFFNSVYMGLSVGQSFSNASGAMDRYQTAWLDDTGDGLWDKDDDGAAADARVIGATFIAGADRPQIGKINANQSIVSGTSALLWAADVASVYPIEEVFAVIVPPSFQPNPDHDPEQPVTELPRVKLIWNAPAFRYEGTYNDFSETGAYKVVLYARDIWDSLSYPKQTYVNQMGSTEKAIIVAGDTAFNAYSPWEYSNALANYAYRTCLDRWIGKERIRYYNGLPGQDVDGNGAADDVYASPGLAGLADAMTGWASDALRLTVYLVGEMGEDRFQLNSTEALYSDQLAAWLDALASEGVQRITVVLEGDASGSFVDDLEGAERNVIASCSSGGTALNQVDGMLSFSQFFWNKVLNGINVRDSFQFGRQAMRFVTSYAQQAAIQDGAGGALAVQTWIGAAFVTGEEAPTIGAVSEDGYCVEGQTPTLWASQVSDPDGIERVWALVMPPDYDPALDLIDEVTLAYHASQARYEAALGGLERIGQYRVTFFAEDREGNLSAPTQTTLLYGMDAYEDDDTRQDSALLFVNRTAQYHNFHDAGDADWVKFYLFGGRGYSLEANNLEDRCDVVLNFRDSLGQLIAQVNDWSGSTAEAIPYNASATDAYYLEVIHADGQIFGASTGYELTVLDTGGGHNGLATSIGARSAMCSWDSASGARGYHLYRSLGDPNGPFVRVNASEIAATSYLDEGLEPETLYFYYVKKVDTNGIESSHTGVFYVLTGKEVTSVIRWELY